jgi:signal transduction histidine kinase/CheY-like chemotaxis protein
MTIQKDRGEMYFGSVILMVILSTIFVLILYLPVFLITFKLSISFLLIITILLICYLEIKLLLLADKIAYKNNDSQYYRSGNLFALSTVIILLYLSIPVFISNNDYISVKIKLISSLITIILIFVIITLLKKRKYLPLYMYTLLFLSYTCDTIETNGSVNYFLIYLILFGINTVYKEYNQLFIHFITSNAVICLLFLFDFNILGSSESYQNFLVKWAYTVYIAILILMLSNLSSIKKTTSELAEANISSLMISTPNLIVIVDEINRISHISKPLADLAHIEDFEMSIGRPVIDLFPEMEMKLLISEIISSSEVFSRTTQLTISGQTRYFQIISVSFQGEIKGRFIDISDVSQIMEAKLEAEKSNATKSNFLAKMSHEIRTPMSAIMGMTDIILRENLTPRVRENALEVKQASLNLLAIINDILDISKIESGKLSINDINYEFIELLKDIIAIIRIRAAEKNLYFTVNIDNNIPSGLYGDSIRIRQIILNILNNAIKYTNKGYIKLKIDYIYKSIDSIELLFSVTDTGLGIKKEDIKYLFNEFSQFDAVKNRLVEGTGLGLSIARNLANLMGGDIKVSSVYGVGSSFKVIIPQRITNKTPLAKVEEPEKQNVLVLEGRPVYAESLTNIMKNFKVSMTLVKNIFDFDDILHKGKFNILMISSKFYNDALKIIKTTNNDFLVVVMTEVDEVISSSYYSIALPILPNNVANIINHQISGEKYNDFKTPTNAFIAPTASILVVDDILTNLKVAEGLLEPYKCEVILCKSGLEAIELIKERHFDLVLMDHMMPEIDGIETTARIRALDESANSIPVVALTANAITGMREVFQQAGFNGFLAKPIDINELNDILDKWLPEDKKHINSLAFQDKLPEVGLRIPGLEVEEAVINTQGSEDKYKELLRIYYFDAWSRLDILRQPLSEGNINEFVTTVHALKSASFNIGARQLSAQMDKLETMGLAKDWVGLAQNTPHVTNDLIELLQKLNSELYIEFGQVSDIDQNLEIILNQLKQSLISSEVTLAEALVEKIINDPLRVDLQRQLSSVSYYILTYDLEQALAIVDGLLGNEKS